MQQIYWICIHLKGIWRMRHHFFSIAQKENTWWKKERKRGIEKKAINRVQFISHSAGCWSNFMKDIFICSLIIIIFFLKKEICLSKEFHRLSKKKKVDKVLLEAYFGCPNLFSLMCLNECMHAFLCIFCCSFFSFLNKERKQSYLRIKLPNYSPMDLSFSAFCVCLYCPQIYM